MTAPDTNVEKQAKRHRPSLFGITLALGAVVLIAVLVTAFLNGDASETSQITPATAVGDQ